MSWPAGAALRQRAVRRQRRRRFAGGAAAAVLVAGGMTAVLTNDGTPPTYPTAAVRTAATLPGAVQLVANVRPLAGTAADAATVARANQAFTVNLLQHLSTGTDNLTVSPWSLYVVLAMLRNAADAHTAMQLTRLLGVDTDTLDRGIAALTTRLGASGTLDTANSLWMQTGRTPTQAFLDTMAQYFHTGTWQTDFSNPKAVDPINAWVDQQTHGTIPHLLDQLDPQTLLVLVNALYFHDDWSQLFQTAEVRDFTTGSGAKTPAPFMSARTELLAGSGYAGARLRYLHGGLTATVVAPTTGALGPWVAGLTTPALASMLTTHGSPGELVLPRFKTTSSLPNLLSTLNAMGVADWSDLPGVSPEAAVTQVVQQTYLNVNERGTTAAAATAGVVTAVSGTVTTNQLVLDHPFLFLITDQTGAVLFASQVNDPSR